MDSLQYLVIGIVVIVKGADSFKPCYKWIAFNTLDLNKNIDFMAF